MEVAKTLVVAALLGLGCVTSQRSQAVESLGLSAAAREAETKLDVPKAGPAREDDGMPATNSASPKSSMLPEEAKKIASDFDVVHGTFWADQHSQALLKYVSEHDPQVPGTEQHAIPKSAP
jgi:hypothetical protein